MREWQEATLGEIADKVGGIIQTGPFGSQLHETDYVREGVPVVMPKDIIEGRVSGSSIARVPESVARRLARHRLEPGDIVYGRRGDIGRQALVGSREQGWLCGTGCLRVSLGRQVVEPLFLHYYLRVPSVVTWIANHAIGATLPNLNTSILRSVPVSFPSLREQRQVASILSAYDDLIENCERRIRVLDEMARALYREWFVLFRYRGTKKVPLDESPRGHVPKGWSVRKLSDVASVNAEQIDTRRPPGTIHYIDISSVSPGTVDSIATLAFADAPGRARRVVRHGDVIWSCVRPNRRSHALILSPVDNTLASTGLAVLRATKAPPTYVYLATTTDDFVAYLEKRATGAAYPAVTASVFENAPILVPDTKTLEAFGRLSMPFAEESAALRRQIGNLRETRDLLLPRLLSGQIDMSDAA